MKIISTGNVYRIYNDSLKTYDKIPVQTYSIGFSPQDGFSLITYPNIEIKEKTYGVHIEKVEKISSAFERTNKNLGVILSGDKGIGKSLFAKMLIIKGVELNYPVIIVDRYIPGIANFLNSIEQPVYVLFDEFDKTFSGKNTDSNNKNDPQTEMLTLFDGLSQGKKMFIITCNELKKLNDYLVNRPGRFHYHLRFDYPQVDEIEEYLTDYNISKEEIKKVISFSRKVKLNYDCLRAIAFELQMTPNFEEAIKDLNILNIEGRIYIITAIFNDGTKIKKMHKLDFFNKTEESSAYFNFPSDEYLDLGILNFLPSDVYYDTRLKNNILPKDKAEWILEINTDIDEDDSSFTEREKKEIKAWKTRTFEYAIIEEKRDENLSYLV